MDQVSEKVNDPFTIGSKWYSEHVPTRNWAEDDSTDANKPLLNWSEDKEDGDSTEIVKLTRNLYTQLSHTHSPTQSFTNEKGTWSITK